MKWSILVVLITLLALVFGFSKVQGGECLSREQVEALFYQQGRDQDSAVRFLASEVESAFLNASCVERKGAELHARADGLALAIRWVGLPDTGHWYQILGISRTKESIIEGIVTEPANPTALRIRLRVGSISAEEIELWHFPNGVRVLRFLDKTTGITTLYGSNYKGEWMLKVGKEAVLYIGPPQRIGSSAAFKATTIPIPGPPTRSISNVWKFTLVVLDYLEDFSWRAGV